MYYGAVDLMKAMIGISKTESTLRKDEFWAIDKLSLTLNRGETLGIIGVNGSGKSTLLRLISGIYPPTLGRIAVKGRIGTLIALGAGFHPHLSGRDNIYLNGVILGMTKKEVNSRLDEIIEFAGLGEFIDSPVATYSSGMTVRLGFSIAIHSSPDILLIDEILAVGDINFQKKCLEKIEEMKKEKAVIFITHSLSHIYRICDKVAWLQNGSIKLLGEPVDVVREYINDSIRDVDTDPQTSILNMIGTIKSPAVYIANSRGEKAGEFEVRSTAAITVEMDVESELDNNTFLITVLSRDGSCITTLSSHTMPMKLAAGRNKVRCVIGNLSIAPGVYTLLLEMYKTPGFNLLEVQYGPFSVIENPDGFMPYIHGYYREDCVWEQS